MEQQFFYIVDTYVMCVTMYSSGDSDWSSWSGYVRTSFIADLVEGKVKGAVELTYEEVAVQISLGVIPETSSIVPQPHYRYFVCPR